MATSDYQTNSFCYIFGLFCLMFLLQRGNAAQFTVGGAKGWTVPDNSTSYTYNQWAEHTRFQIGDSLLFVYKADQDSVVEVNKQDYHNCSSTSPVSPPLSDGHSVFTFNRSGPHYFISGKKENCLKNEKLVVIVLSERSNHSSNGNAPVPAASPPTPAASASPTPSGDTNTMPSPTPSPATSGEETPAAGTVEISPSPPPESSEPHSGASSSMLLGFTGFISLILALSS